MINDCFDDFICLIDKHTDFCQIFFKKRYSINGLLYKMDRILYKLINCPDQSVYGRIFLNSEYIKKLISYILAYFFYRQNKTIDKFIDSFKLKVGKEIHHQGIKLEYEYYLPGNIHFFRRWLRHDKSKHDELLGYIDEILYSISNRKSNNMPNKDKLIELLALSIILLNELKTNT